MLVWKKQDLEMAKTLKAYGFTGVCRISKETLGVYFDNGSYRYSLPGICFMFLKTGDFIEIDSLITQCEVNCK